MAAKPKLNADQWAEVRERWENDPRGGFPWLIDEMSLPVSAEALRLRSKSEGWAKASNSKLGNVKEQGKTKLGKNSDSKLGKSSKSKLGVMAAEPAEISAKKEAVKSAGRPSAYCNAVSEQAYKLCLLGATDAELADFFEVTEQTINNWKDSIPEFFESIKKGKAAADAEVAESLFKRATGYSHPEVHVSNYQGEITLTELTKHHPPDTAAAFIWLKNRRPHQWKDKVEVKEDINLNIFPPKEVLAEVFEASLKRSAEKAAALAGRRERLGIVIEVDTDVD